MKHLGLLILVGAAAGCAAEDPPVETAAARNPPGLIPVTEPLQGDQKQFLLVVRLRMASVELPVGTASGSEDLWSYLDEEPHGPGGAVGLGLNGVRIGSGPKQSWPDFVKALEKLTGQKFMETQVLVVPGHAMPIRLKEQQPQQTIFTFHADRTLTGADYPPGDNLLTVTCTLNADDPATVLITGVPQIRSAPRGTEYVKRPAGFLVVPKRTYYSFRPMTFQMPVKNGDFVVVGPGAESRRPDSVGHHFLIRTKKGVEFETVLVFIPEVFRSAVR